MSRTGNGRRLVMQYFASVGETITNHERYLKVASADSVRPTWQPQRTAFWQCWTPKGVQTSREMLY
ncbi:MAG TPA: hypothetical protein VHE60_04795 [Pyrinomonadaceae bacterium]|nr:hypothetical protein [Pyrinomonadaceae bacterium]